MLDGWLREVPFLTDFCWLVRRYPLICLPAWLCRERLLRVPIDEEEFSRLRVTLLCCGILLLWGLCDCCSLLL